jgi:hypothetical protein
MPPVTAKPWSEILDHFATIGAEPGREVAPIVRLLVWIRQAGLESSIFATTSLADLIIADRASFRMAENILRVAWDTKKAKVHFSYHRTQGAPDAIETEASEAESIGIFREILAYKFGVFPREGGEADSNPDPG